MTGRNAVLVGTLLALALPAAAQLRDDPGDPHTDHGQARPGDPAMEERGAPPAPHPRHTAPHRERGETVAPRAERAAASDARPPGDAGAHSAAHGAPGSEHAAHAADADSHAHHGMVLDAGGMVMNANPDRLPRDCPQISGDVEIRVQAGRAFAPGPGLAYGYDRAQWTVAPCSRVHVRLETEDAVRHQWMVHGLPRYLYPMGMFSVEVNGPGERSASFIVPSGAQTYLVHCDVPHHTEKGMKAQLVVGAGSGTLPSVPGLSAPTFGDRYPKHWTLWAWGVLALAAGGGFALSAGLLRP